MTTTRRTVRLIALLLRPWAIGAALLGALAAAFPQSADGDPGSVGGAISFQRSAWPHPRTVVLESTFREAPESRTQWMEGGGRPVWGISWISRGAADPSPTDWWGRSRGAWRGPAVRPAGAMPDEVRITTSLWYLLGLPALGSVAVVWWRLRRGVEWAEDGPPGGRPATAWRLARSWLWAFGPVGALLAASGGDLGSKEPTGPFQYDQTRVGVLSSQPDAWSAPPDARTTRLLSVWHRRADDRSGAVPRAEREWGQVERDWGSDALGALARRWRAPILGNGWDADGSGWSVSVSIWWLVGLAAACNLVTLARLARRRGTGRSG